MKTVGELEVRMMKKQGNEIEVERYSREGR